MKRVVVACVLSLIGITVASQWREDILGDNYKCVTINHPDDYSGKVVSTVVRKLSDESSTIGVLHIHGYNDYFFQKELGNVFVNAGINFYAADLRKYGRSIIDRKKAFEARDIKEYYADIDSAISIMKHDGVRHIIIMGHSTGGLISLRYLQDNKVEDISGLILNSPFLEWNMSAVMKDVAIPVVGNVGRFLPDWPISQGSSTAYGESLHKDFHGEWEYNLEWKLMPSPDVRAGWLRAIDNAHAALRCGTKINVPILLMHSERSVYGEKWNEDFMSGDAVLNVDDISRIGRTLGYSIREATVKGGLHDLVLSRQEIRNAVYDSMLRWIDELTAIYRQ